jgi:HPt (histidine-containing phosphotransfer) domain-containing protein
VPVDSAQESAPAKTPEALAVAAAFAQIRARYGARLLAECEALQRELSRQELDALRVRLHTLKGSAGTFGFVDVSEAAAQAEAVLKSDESFDLPGLQALLAPVIDALKAAGDDVPLA